MEHNVLDTVHRGYAAYQTETENDKTHHKLLQMILSSESEDERCDTVLLTCDVKSDWLDEIEKTMPFIERAISENRQFILRQGEIVPIEKVRRVSKTSVEHLARHSQMITREPAPGEDIIPEKILMTENVGTYAVYENRFLYMLLCYIKDFVQIKYSKISDLCHSFTAETVLEKNLNAPNQKINFSLHFKESATGVALPEYTKKTAECLERMKNALLSVNTLLKTSLMIEVSAAPVLKPPITRTNVLIHNPCFAAAVDLFDYLSAYQGEGYTVRELYRHEGGFDLQIREDYARLINLTSYLAYRQGGLLESLESRYRDEEEERKAKERAADNQRLAEMKAQIVDLSPEAAEYILALEKKCERADEEFSRLADVRQMARMAEQKVAEAEEIKAAAEQELSEKDEQLCQLALSARQAEKVYREKLGELNLQLTQKDEEKQKLIEDHADRVSALTEQFRTEYAEIAERYHLQSARLHALQAKAGYPEIPQDEREDFASKQGFALLEAEYAAFKHFYNAQWKLAKAKIRQERLSKHAIQPSQTSQKKETSDK